MLHHTSVKFLLVCWLIVRADIYEMTRQEAAHTGIKYSIPAIVNEFMASSWAQSSDISRNDMAAHHNIVTYFCKQRKTKTCTWREYYNVFDHIRQPYENMFDPGAHPIGEGVEDIQKKSRSGHLYQDTCHIIENPTAKEFFEYVVGNKPVIIRGVIPSRFQSKDWLLENLKDVIGDSEVVVSAAPTADFDGPESFSLWGLYNYSTADVDLIVRPAHVNMLFSEYADLLSRRDRNISSLYLEYFPMPALFMQHRVKSGKNEIISQLPRYEWANFLISRYHLLWLGGGSNSPESTASPTSRLHFDRMENLMTVIAGSKIFRLYDPSQSEYLNGGGPVISASFSAHLHRRQGGPPSITFTRSPTTISHAVNTYHTYSPVNIRQPNYDRHPRYKYAKEMVCTVESGDTLYLPSHWWHEVTSTPDHEGKSIGVNKFFEPFYNRLGFKTTTNRLQRNRYYAHLYPEGNVMPCSEDDVCFLSDGLLDPETDKEFRRSDHMDEIYRDPYEHQTTTSTKSRIETQECHSDQPVYDANVKKNGVIDRGANRKSTVLSRYPKRRRRGKRMSKAVCTDSTSESNGNAREIRNRNEKEMSALYRDKDLRNVRNRKDVHGEDEFENVRYSSVKSRQRKGKRNAKRYRS